MKLAIIGSREKGYIKHSQKLVNMAYERWSDPFEEPDKPELQIITTGYTYKTGVQFAVIFRCKAIGANYKVIDMYNSKLSDDYNAGVMMSYVLGESDRIWILSDMPFNPHIDRLISLNESSDYKKDIWQFSSEMVCKRVYPKPEIGNVKHTKSMSDWSTLDALSIPLTDPRRIEIMNSKDYESDIAQEIYDLAMGNINGIKPGSRLKQIANDIVDLEIKKNQMETNPAIEISLNEARQLGFIAGFDKYNDPIAKRASELALATGQKESSVLGQLQKIIQLYGTDIYTPSFKNQYIYTVNRENKSFKEVKDKLRKQAVKQNMFPSVSNSANIGGVSGRWKNEFLEKYTVQEVKFTEAFYTAKPENPAENGSQGQREVSSKEVEVTEERFERVVRKVKLLD